LPVALIHRAPKNKSFLPNIGQDAFSVIEL